MSATTRPRRNSWRVFERDGWRKLTLFLTLALKLLSLTVAPVSGLDSLLDGMFCHRNDHQLLLLLLKSCFLDAKLKSLQSRALKFSRLFSSLIILCKNMRKLIHKKLQGATHQITVIRNTDGFATERKLPDEVRRRRCKTAVEKRLAFFSPRSLFCSRKRTATNERTNERTDECLILN